MAVHQAYYCIAQNQQKLVASINQALYNHAHDDWMVLVRVDFTLPFNEGVDGSSPSCLNFFLEKIRDMRKPTIWLPNGLEVKTACGRTGFSPLFEIGSGW
jgi:hypothetical protein